MANISQNKYNEKYLLSKIGQNTIIKLLNCLTDFLFKIFLPTGQIEKKIKFLISVFSSPFIKFYPQLIYSKIRQKTAILNTAAIDKIILM